MLLKFFFTATFSQESKLNDLTPANLVDSMNQADLCVGDAVEIKEPATAAAEGQEQTLGQTSRGQTFSFVW